MKIGSTEMSMVHRLPRARCVDRIAFLEHVCRGKRVVHCGFWGTEGIRESTVGKGTWLHGRLGSVAKEIIGLDVNEEGVSAARRAGYSAQAVDLSDPDATRDLSISGEVVVAGELIEHVESPGSFLEALHPLLEAGGRLIITTPNASALSSPLLAMTSREYVNADHIAIYSWYTLTNLVSRHDWDVSWVGTYRRPRSTSLLGRLAFAPENLLAEGWPFIAGGLIVVCQSGRANRRGSAETTVG